MAKKPYESQINELISEVASYNPKTDIGLIERAWDFSVLAHFGQKRLSGEDYILHCLRIGKQIVDWRLDTTSVVAGLLHDSVREGGAKQEDLVKEFGKDVAFLVEGVTKVTDIRLKGSKDEEFVENLRKMFLAMAKDLRVVFVKLADRLDSVQTLWALPKKSQIENAQENLDIYAPLAGRLGMGYVKGELEDLSFPYVYPKEYEWLVKESKTHYKDADLQIIKMKKRILKCLAKEKIKADITARKKHLYSLWKKLQRSEIDKDFGKIYDIVAIRIIVDIVEDCYKTLGLVHGLYKPVLTIGISDYIAQPRTYGYRSIHSRVFAEDGRVIEVQIRTHEMHEQAEYGVAAHWAYSELKTKKGISEGVGVGEEKLSWVRQLVKWQEEAVDSQEFLKAVKFDALAKRILVFSPKGDVYDLPEDATAIDFAYAVHTKLSHYVKCAKVDGKIVALNYKLKNGQVVEIEKNKNAKKPNRDWLEFVVTQTARREIRKSW